MQVLTGIKVLDLTKWLPGQYCTMVLGDFGAEVIKVEDLKGDATRQFQPQKSSDMSFWHLALNRNKKGLAVDLRSVEGRQIIRKLMLEADVVVESFRPGIMTKMDADYETIKKLKPSIIYCSLTGFGQTGKYKNMPAHDLNIVGLAGITTLDMAGNAAVSPVQVSGIGGSMNAVTGILLALLARERTGVGQYIDIGLYNSALNFEVTSIAALFGQLEVDGEAGAERIGHYYNLYQTKDDRYLTVGTIEPKFWRELCLLIEKPELSEHQFDFQHSAKLRSILKETFLTKTLAEWVALIGKKEFCVTPVLSLEEAMASEIASESGLLTKRSEEWGDTSYLKSAIKLSATPATIERRAPYLGEHTEEVLRSLGYTEQKLLALKEQGII